jgi:hypothetical protein
VVVDPGNRLGQRRDPDQAGFSGAIQTGCVR